MKYDATVINTEEEYAAFVEWLEDRTASELRVARSNEDATRTAILKYLETGYTAHLTPSELVDFFSLHHNGTLSDQRGSSPTMRLVITQIFSRI